MNLKEVKHRTNFVHLVDLDSASPATILCGANIWKRSDGLNVLLTSTNRAVISGADARCKKCLKAAGETHRLRTDEEVETTRKGLEAMLAMDKPELQGLGPVQYALAVWLLDNGAAEPQRGYGHISAAELAEKLYDSGWIRDT